MISLSNVFKPSQVREVPNPVKIALHLNQTVNESGTPDNPQHSEPADAQQVHLRDNIIAEAQQLAEQIVKQAHDEADALMQGAREDIDSWWEERRADDVEMVEQAKTDGFQSGYEEGLKQAEEEMKQHYADLIQEAQQLVEQGFQVKNQIIAEAEPFLLELSTAIAEKIVQRHLADSPELHLQWIQGMLARKREKGVITLCVAPSQFMFINASREELTRSIDSQAELQIIPDASVQDAGCMIRSALGTIDARIDTQLNEIKKALLSVFSADGDVKE
jgi:flagellar assembly protein FliH